MDAFFPVELRRSAAFAGREGLAGTYLDAELRGASRAELRVEGNHVVGVAGRGLHLAAHEQRVLVGDEQPAVEGDVGPAAAVHERVVAGHAAAAAILEDPVQLGGGDAAPGIQLLWIKRGHGSPHLMWFQYYHYFLNNLKA